MKLIDWFRGWKETLRIKYREPELYRFLVECKIEDCGEVPPP